MNYTFVKYQLHSKLPKLTEWRLLVTPDRGDVGMLLPQLQGIFSKAIFQKFYDPHINKAPWLQSVVGIVPLTTKWITTVMAALNSGRALLFNSKGGYCDYAEKREVERLQSSELVWPTEGAEVITLSRWPENPHWYPSSSSGRDFEGRKFNTVAEAKRVIKRMLPTAEIKVKAERRKGGDS